MVNPAGVIDVFSLYTHWTSPLDLLYWSRCMAEYRSIAILFIHKSIMMTLMTTQAYPVVRGRIYKWEACFLLLYSWWPSAHAVICKSGGTCPVPYGVGVTLVGQFHPKQHHKTAIQSILPVFAFKRLHRVILSTRFCKLLTGVTILSGGGHVPQVPQWHDVSETTKYLETFMCIYACVVYGTVVLRRRTSALYCLHVVRHYVS